MRNKITYQQSLVESFIAHDHVKELQQIELLFLENPQIADLIHADLVRNLKCATKGRTGILSAGQVFKILLIKQMNGFSYKDLHFHLTDSRAYGRFCGFGFFDNIPSVATIARDIKKLRPETLEKINWLLLETAKAKGIEKGRKVRVDSTVVESNISSPTDSALLHDCVRVLSRLAKRVRVLLDVQISGRSRSARKLSLSIMNARNKAERVKDYKRLIKITKTIVADCKHVLVVMKEVQTRTPLKFTEILDTYKDLNHYVELAEQVINQTEQRVLKGKKLSPGEKLVSIFEPHTDIIIKDRREVHYGHKIVLTNGKSGLFTDLVIEEGNPTDSTLAVKMITRQKKIYGRVPRQVSLDGGFASKSNLQDIKSLGVNDVVFAKKRGLKVDAMAKSTWVYKRLRDFRAGIEGMISYLKRCFGLTRCTWSGFQSFKSYVWASVLTANALLLARRLLE